MDGFLPFFNNGIISVELLWFPVEKLWHVISASLRWDEININKGLMQRSKQMLVSWRKIRDYTTDFLFLPGSQKYMWPAIVIVKDDAFAVSSRFFLNDLL